MNSLNGGCGRVISKHIYLPDAPSVRRDWSLRAPASSRFLSAAKWKSCEDSDTERLAVDQPEPPTERDVRVVIHSHRYVCTVRMSGGRFTFVGTCLKLNSQSLWVFHLLGAYHSKAGKQELRNSRLPVPQPRLPCPHTPPAVLALSKESFSIVLRPGSRSMGAQRFRAAI
ncbi:unnamed protein product [Pleuronectes platessa]|uniref:Uncharacterized protein n=1 Tax=Pleuronectes platessa TaxID=8262 RepID=A0A9N7UDB5_PLEPL|nr:unnamed protein product [Pleuronectes platessa]